MYIAETHSTNTLLRELIARGEWPEGEKYLRAGYQTAGRGQTGNGWESEAGKNLLCSILLPPSENLFDLNIIMSVAVHRLVCCVYGLIADEEEVTIKWPNDIYFRDKKIAGILIENAIVGSEVSYSIAGIGININQTTWQSDAPNPISWAQISGEEYELDAVMNVLLEQIDEVLKMPIEEVRRYYRAHLYRREGYWPFVEREVSVTPTMNAAQQTQGQFLARITDVLPTGEIVLEDLQGKQHTYHFKQIRYVL
ncbi:MAG: biotin--[Paludibacteraceae bacterium]|nr:biotin--[acetyl-CoA-carboxylase] ligase [Paludibacteraceae bacterium]